MCVVLIMVKIGFIGAGITGTALAMGLNCKGYPVVAVGSRSRPSSLKFASRVRGCKVYDSAQDVADAADVVFITTSDSYIAPTVGGICWHQGQGVVHCCGSESTDILEPAKENGALTGTFHPLQTFAGVENALENFPGSTIAIEAKPPLLETLKDFATALGARWIELKARDRVLYHASAVIASNYLVTLVKMAAEVWQAFDIPQQQALKALLPLIKGTIRNIECVGIPDCLTGPISRGDIATIKKHLNELQNFVPESLAIYRELGLRTIPIAVEKGKIDDEQARQLKVLLASKVENPVN